MTTETTTTRPLVKDMDEQARIAYLAGLVGKPVRYTLLSSAQPLIEAFGQHATFVWHMGIVEHLGLTSDNAPRLVVKHDSQSTLFGMTFTRDLPRFDDLYDVEAYEPFAETLPDAPDYDGDDVYAADEVACPHCGQTVRVVMRATLSIATAEEHER